MSNNTCPICGKSTQGKPVRKVHFCEEHRLLAVQIRDEFAASNGNVPITGRDLVNRMRTHVGTTTRETVDTILANVTEGMLLKMTFKVEAAAELTYLLGMLNNGFLATTAGWDESGITAVALSRKWEYVKRTFVFRIVRWGETEKDWFKGRLGRAIEDLEIQYA